MQRYEFDTYHNSCRTRQNILVYHLRYSDHLKPLSHGFFVANKLSFLESLSLLARPLDIHVKKMSNCQNFATMNKINEVEKIIASAKKMVR